MTDTVWGRAESERERGRPRELGDSKEEEKKDDERSEKESRQRI